MYFGISMTIADFVGKLSGRVVECVQESLRHWNFDIFIVARWQVAFQIKIGQVKSHEFRIGRANNAVYQAW